MVPQEDTGLLGLADLFDKGKPHLLLSFTGEQFEVDHNPQHIEFFADERMLLLPLL